MIQRATLADVAELNGLVNSAYRGDSSRQGWTTEADLLEGTRTDEAAIIECLSEPHSLVLKFIDNEKIIGCVRLLKHGNSLYLGMFAVNPTIQGQGIGKKLLQAAEEEAQAQNCTSIDMTVISKRKELIDWYKRNGYIETNEKKPVVFTKASEGKPKEDLYFITLVKNLNSK